MLCKSPSRCLLDLEFAMLVCFAESLCVHTAACKLRRLNRFQAAIVEQECYYLYYTLINLQFYTNFLKPVTILHQPNCDLMQTSATYNIWGLYKSQWHGPRVSLFSKPACACLLNTGPPRLSCYIHPRGAE